MDSLLKEAAKKAPVPSLAVALFYFVASKVLDMEVNIWIILLIISFTFILSLSLVWHKEKKNEKQEINISNQEVDNVSTDGGDVLIGAERLDKANLNIEKNKINKVKTGGGDFTIGRGRK